MCGILTAYSPKTTVPTSNLTAALNSIKHRGPDYSDIKTFFNGTVVLGSNRLAIVDLSLSANQPLEVGDYCINFNGEIYNYKELRSELINEGIKFSTHSDTEVVVRAINKWGINTALKKFIGCFAFSLLDKANKVLYIVRDPIGEKQLVYTKTANGSWYFASEAKALLKMPEVTTEPNINYFVEDLIFNLYANQSDTFFKNIYNFPSGEYLTIHLTNNKPPKFTKYWDIHKFTTEKNVNVQDDFIKTLRNSVALQMDPDTDIGSVLSGGIDSSLITALGAPQHFKKYGKKIMCFTTYYDTKLNRDLDNAKLLVKSFNKSMMHNKIKVKSITLKDLEAVTYALEKPVADKVYYSIWNNYRSAKERDLKTVINGQGSDELWLGYYKADPIFRQKSSIYERQNFEDYWLRSSYFEDLFNTNIKVKAIVNRNLKQNFHVFKDKYLDKLIKFSINTHLQNLLQIEDRLSMANAIEVRLPFLDIRLIELALRTNSKQKILDSREKYIVRKASAGLIPSSIVNRKKSGFKQPPFKCDYEIEKTVDEKIISQSRILKLIIKDTQKINSLPVRERWALLSIAIMENVYFKQL